MTTTMIPRLDQSTADAHCGPVEPGQLSSSGQKWGDAHRTAAAAGTDLPADQAASDARCSSVGGDQTWNGPAAAISVAMPNDYPSLADPFLALAADVLDDAERTHIANANRLRQLTRTGTDVDGEERGFGLDESHPDVARLAALVALLAKVEHDATLNLNRHMRKHPLYPFTKGLRGVGDKQVARLLASIGDPYWNGLHDRPRTVSELWSYCGLHVLPVGRRVADPQQLCADGDSSTAGGDSDQWGHDDTQRATVGIAARRHKGQRANWSTIAKTRAWLVIESCMKQLDAACKTDTGIAEHLEGCHCSPYRVVIDQRRTHTTTTHPDWTPKHSQLDGMRVASKALLRDLWREAKRIHEENK